MACATTAPDRTRQPCRQHPTRHHPTAPTRSTSPLKKTESTPERHKGPCQKMLTKTSLSALCACGRQRGPTELSSHAKVEELSWGLGWQYSFWQSFRRLLFCAGQRAFLGQLRALKCQSRTEDLVVKEIFRRIYFKVWVPFLNSLFAVVWVKPWCKPDTTK